MNTPALRAAAPRPRSTLTAGRHPRQPPRTHRRSPPRGWLGEVDGLQISLTGARQKLAQLDQITTRTASTHLGMPSFPQIAGRSSNPAPSERSWSSAENKKTFGFHRMLAFCDNTGEFLAAQRRKGNAASNTAIDHVTVLDAALAQLPVIPEKVWADAIDADGGHREGAGLAEITGVLPAPALTGYPTGMRVIVRRERPSPWPWARDLAAAFGRLVTLPVPAG